MEDIQITGLRESIAGFDSVWSRVSGKAPEREPHDREDLRSLIGRELAVSSAARALARSAPGQPIFRQPAFQASARARRLQAELFIREGEQYRPEPRQDAAEPLLCRLRWLLLQYQALEKTYLNGAEYLPAALRERFAEQCSRSADRIRAIILRAFYAVPG